MLDTPRKMDAVLPSHEDLFYAGGWHPPRHGGYIEAHNPADGHRLGRFSDATREDVDAAVSAAAAGFAQWRAVAPLERAKILRAIGVVIRKHSEEIGHLDCLDCGSPIKAMINDAMVAAARFDFFAGLVTELKGDSIPMGADAVNFTVREPMGVVARIVAFNHPFMFAATKMPAPLAAGNAIIIKPPEQASLSALRLAELVGDMLPPGVFSVLTGAREVGEALTTHRDVRMVGLVGSVGTGRAVMRSAAETLKPVLLELGGKNALIAYPDADPEEVAAAAVDGMNYLWCGQSCGSTSRIFLHDDIHDAVLDAIRRRITAFKPGLPGDPATTMGAVISKAQYERIMAYIEKGRSEGATLVCGGRHPPEAELSAGFFIEPTVFADVRQDMTIAREEIFGPVMSVIRWRDEQAMIADVNAVEVGLTCAIWTDDIRTAHRTAARVDAGYVWINEVSKHFAGAPFGGVKQSGIGREEGIGEMFAFTQEKNVHVSLKRRPL